MICFTFKNWLAREKVHWSRQALQLEAEVHVRKDDLVLFAGTRGSRENSC